VSKGCLYYSVEYTGYIKNSEKVFAKIFYKKMRVGFPLIGKRRKQARAGRGILR